MSITSSTRRFLRLALLSTFLGVSCTTAPPHEAKNTPPSPDAYQACQKRIENLELRNSYDASDLEAKFSALDHEAQQIEKLWGTQKDLTDYGFLKSQAIEAMIGYAKYQCEGRIPALADLSPYKDRIDKQIWLALEKIDRLQLRDAAQFIRDLNNIRDVQFSVRPIPSPIPEWSQLRTREARCIFTIWARLKKSIDPKFDENTNNYIDRFTNLPFRGIGGPPPTESEKALWAKYNATYERFIEQGELRNLLSNDWPQLEKWLIDAYQEPPDSSAELQNLLHQYVSNQNLRQRIRSAVTLPATSILPPNMTRDEVENEIIKMGVGIDRRNSAKTGPVVWVTVFSNTDMNKALQLFGRLPQLENVNLSHSKVNDAQLKYLSQLPNLQYLFLTGCTRFTDAGLDPLMHLKHLQTLWLDGTRVSDAGLRHLAGLQQLNDLHLENTNVTDAALIYLKPMNQLMGLYLTNTRVTDAGLQQLAGLNKLRSLDLEHTKVTSSGLQYLQGLNQLGELYLNGCPGVTDAGLDYLQGLKYLTDLGLKETSVTEAGVKKLQDALPQCHIVY